MAAPHVSHVMLAMSVLKAPHHHHLALVNAQQVDGVMEISFILVSLASTTTCQCLMKQLVNKGKDQKFVLTV
jgi:cellobiose-specific phosphotransferase system component IIA